MGSNVKHTVEQLNALKPARSILTAISLERIIVEGKYRTRIRCSCECGNSCLKSTYDFTHRAYSCGCLSEIYRISKIQKYFPVNHKIRACWRWMIDRCYNPKSSKYRFYGGKGVVVCNEWVNDYQKFLDWALVNGWGDGLEIDKDIKGAGMLYSPDTCCFVTSKQNKRARSHLVKIKHKGRERLLVDVCEELGLKCDVVRQRMSRDGLTQDEALSRPTGGGVQHFPHKKPYHHSEETKKRLSERAKERVIRNGGVAVIRSTKDMSIVFKSKLD